MPEGVQPAQSSLHPARLGVLGAVFFSATTIAAIFLGTSIFSPLLILGPLITLTLCLAQYQLCRSLRLAAKLPILSLALWLLPALIVLGYGWWSGQPKQRFEALVLRPLPAGITNLTGKGFTGVGGSWIFAFQADQAALDHIVQSCQLIPTLPDKFLSSPADVSEEALPSLLNEEISAHLSQFRPAHIAWAKPEKTSNQVAAESARTQPTLKLYFERSSGRAILLFFLP